MTAKPICVVYVSPDGNGYRSVTWGDCIKMSEHHLKTMPDYHWFFILSNEYVDIEFKVFYEKDFSETKYEELKSIITNAIEQTKNNHQ